MGHNVANIDYTPGELNTFARRSIKRESSFKYTRFKGWRLSIESDGVYMFIDYAGRNAKRGKWQKRTKKVLLKKGR